MLHVHVQPTYQRTTQHIPIQIFQLVNLTNAHDTHLISILTNPATMSALENTLHKIDDNSTDPERPNEHTREALGSEPNVTGTDRPAPKGGEFQTATHAQGHEEQQQQQQQPGGDQPRISRGHHHPRRPVGATGLPPNHK